MKYIFDHRDLSAFYSMKYIRNGQAYTYILIDDLTILEKRGILFVYVARIGVFWNVGSVFFFIVSWICSETIKKKTPLAFQNSPIRAM